MPKEVPTTVNKAWIEQIIFITDHSKRALECPPARTDKYGIITPGKVDGAPTEVLEAVKKPAKDTTKSNLMTPREGATSRSLRR